jgi:putative membrane protein
MPVFLAIILLFAGQVALTDDTSDASACAPAGPDLIAGLYQFDLFQQNAIEAADRSGSEELRLSAVSKADAATQRDRALLELQRKTGTEVLAPGKSAARSADRLAGLDSATEPGSAREFYEAEVAAHQSAVQLLQRYLSAPDNKTIKEFAVDQLPAIESGLKDAQAALASKDED